MAMALVHGQSTSGRLLYPTPGGAEQGSSAAEPPNRMIPTAQLPPALLRRWASTQRQGGRECGSTSRTRAPPSRRKPDARRAGPGRAAGPVL